MIKASISRLFLLLTLILTPALTVFGAPQHRFSNRSGQTSASSLKKDTLKIIDNSRLIGYTQIDSTRIHKESENLTPYLIGFFISPEENYGEKEETTYLPEKTSKANSTDILKGNIYKDVFKKNGIADNLTVALGVATTGFSFDLSTPVTKWARIRTGVDWLPQLKVPMTFDLTTFSDGKPSDNFNHVQELLYEMTGLEISDEIKMIGRPRMLNFKFIVDVFPFRADRRWYFSAGFYAGTRLVATAVNAATSKRDLVALNIYNRGYDYFTNVKDIFDVPLGGGVYMDPEVVLKLKEKFHQYGRMGVHVGDFKNGDPYVLEPAPDGSVSAKAYVNSFKPYLGAGFSTPLDKTEKWKLTLDLGMLIWGGAPSVINHDYKTDKDINFTKDLRNIPGKVGDYMRFIKALPVYPLLSIRVSYDIF